MKRIRLVIPLLFTVFLCQATGLSPLPSIGTPAKEVVASWYGKAHEGRKTASGAVFRRQLMTAAHRTAQFGTHYLVFYKDQVVEVLVNDRGPYVKRNGSYSRDLDLSEAAARCLGLAEAGAAKVRLLELPLPSKVDAERLRPLSPGVCD